MKYTISLILFFCILHPFSTALPEETAASSDTPSETETRDSEKLQGLEEKIAVDLKNMDVLEVLKFLATKAGLNITTGNNVGGRVTLFMSDISIKDALEIIVFNNDLGYVIKNNVIHIMTNETYKALYGKLFNESREMKIVSLEHSSPKEVSAMLGQLKSEKGKILINTTTKTVVLFDFPEKIKEMEVVLGELEAASSTVQKIFKLKYAKAEDIQANITETLTPEIGKLKIDKRTDTFIITDTKKNMRKIKRIIRAFDEMPAQVRIETEIVEINLTDEFKMGVEWENLLQSARSFDLVGSFPANITSTVSQKIAVGKIPGDDFSAVITLLKSVGETKVLSTPRITTLSGKEAKIHVGRKDAYLTCTQTVPSDISNVTTTTSSEVEYVDIGITLNVTPVVSRDGYITMSIKPEVSTKVETLEIGCVSVPIIETSEAETNVIIKNGSTVLIAGLMKEEKSEQYNKVPVLGDIPLLGMMFRSTSETLLKTELVIFITPTIVTGEGDIAAAEVKESKPMKRVKMRHDRKPMKPMK